MRGGEECRQNSFARVSFLLRCILLIPCLIRASRLLNTFSRSGLRNGRETPKRGYALLSVSISASWAFRTIPQAHAKAGKRILFIPSGYIFRRSCLVPYITRSVLEAHARVVLNSAGCQTTVKRKSTQHTRIDRESWPDLIRRS